MNNRLSCEDRSQMQEDSSEEKSHDFFVAGSEIAHYINVLRVLAATDLTKTYGYELKDLQNAFTGGKHRFNLAKTSRYAKVALETGQKMLDDETIWQAIKPEGGTIKNSTYTRDQLRAFMSESIQNTRTLIGRF